MNQDNIFSFLMPAFKITKPLRIIELFSGVCTFSMAARDLCMNYETWKTCEWDVHPAASAKAIHNGNDHTDYSANLSKSEIIDKLHELGISNDGKAPMKSEAIKRKQESWLRATYNNIKSMKNLVNVTKVCAPDLEIVDKDKYQYLLTYSFPCQDLSSAGKQKGMAKGSETRSALLWEVERLLGELSELKQLPDLLIMENVPDIIEQKNIRDFTKWYAQLEKHGYQSYYKILNANNYGIPQNRDRCFMISILGNYSYEFPQKQLLAVRMKDLLEKHADEKYYLSKQTISSFIENSLKNKKKGNGYKFEISNGDGIAKAITTNAGGRMTDNFISEPTVKQTGNCTPAPKRDNPSAERIYDQDGLSQTITTMQGGNTQPMIIESVICASRGRNPENPKSRKSGLPTKQMIEVNTSGCSNALTTVQKDNLVLERVIDQADMHEDGVVVTDVYNRNTKVTDTIGTITANGNASNTHCGTFWIWETNVRIRKLTPLECWRLMGYTDDDFHKAEKVNSNSQLYKQAGNGIVKQVVMALLKQLENKEEKE